MVKAEELIKYMLLNDYTFYISTDLVYKKIIEKHGGTFVQAVNDRIATSMAAGMKLAGIRAFVFINKPEYFIKLVNSFCNDYSIGILGHTNLLNFKTNGINYLKIKEDYKEKLTPHLKKLNTNKESLLLVQEEVIL